jgi:hypothetical protein
LGALPAARKLFVCGAYDTTIATAYLPVPNGYFCRFRVMGPPPKSPPPSTLVLSAISSPLMVQLVIARIDLG